MRGACHRAALRADPLAIAPYGLAMLRNKHVEMPGRKHDNLPV
jgi:hypothetical protein